MERDREWGAGEEQRKTSERQPAQPAPHCQTGRSTGVAGGPNLHKRGLCSFSFAREHQNQLLHHRHPFHFTDESLFTQSTLDRSERVQDNAKSFLLPATSLRMSDLACAWFRRFSDCTNGSQSSEKQEIPPLVSVWGLLQPNTSRWRRNYMSTWQDEPQPSIKYYQ